MECVRSVFFVVQLCQSRLSLQEVGSRRQFVPSRVEDDPQRAPSTTRFMATWNVTELFITRGSIRDEHDSSQTGGEFLKFKETAHQQRSRSLSKRPPTRSNGRREFRLQNCSKSKRRTKIVPRKPRTLFVPTPTLRSRFMEWLE